MIEECTVHSHLHKCNSLNSHWIDIFTLYTYVITECSFAIKHINLLYFYHSWAAQGGSHEIMWKAYEIILQQLNYVNDPLWCYGIPPCALWGKDFFFLMIKYKVPKVGNLGTTTTSTWLSVHQFNHDFFEIIMWIANSV